MAAPKKKTFFGRIFSGIGNFLKKFFSDDQLHKYAKAAIEVVDVVKVIVENPFTKTVTLLTPTPIDDLLVAEAKELLPVVATSLETGVNLIGKSPDEVLLGLANIIRQYDPSERGPKYQKLAALIVQARADGKVTLSESLDIVDEVYKSFIKK